MEARGGPNSGVVLVQHGALAGRSVSVLRTVKVGTGSSARISATSFWLTASGESKSRCPEQRSANSELRTASCEVGALEAPVDWMLSVVSSPVAPEELSEEGHAVLGVVGVEEVEVPKAGRGSR